jgi:hypothetical protein
MEVNQPPISAYAASKREFARFSFGGAQVLSFISQRRL